MIPFEDLNRVNARFLPEMQNALATLVSSEPFILGRAVEEFEEAFARYTQTNYCVGVASGLDALELSLQVLSLPAGAEVIVPSNTYIATVLAIISAGCRPILVEPDPATYNLTASGIAAAITRRTAAILVVHLYGKMAPMDAIMELAAERGIFVIEDAAQAHGAYYAGRPAGSWGNLAAFSFYPTKNLGAIGDGGAIVTANAEWAQKLKALRNYGSHKKYFNRYVGVNSRLDALQARFLLIKLQHLDAMVEHKRKLANLYLKHLDSTALTLPVQVAAGLDAYHLFVVRTSQRDKLRAHLAEKGIGSEIHYPVPPHRQEAMQPYLYGDYPLADLIHQTCLSLPCSFCHSENEILEVIEACKSFSHSNVALLH